MKTLESIRKQLKSICKCIIYFMKFAWKEKPLYFFFVAGSILVQSAGPFITIIGTRYLINEIAYRENRNINNVIFWISFICIGTLVYKILTKITMEKQYNISQGIFELKLITDLSIYAVKMKFQNTENPDILNKIQNAEKGINETDQIQGITDGLITICSNFFVLAGVIYLVISSSIWLLIPILLSFTVSTISYMKITEYRKKYFEKLSGFSRGFDYYDEELSENKYAKDIRIYDAGEMLLKNQAHLNKEQYNMARHELGKFWKCERISIFVENFCNIAIYCVLAVNVLRKFLNLGEFSSLVQAATQFTQSLTGIVDGYFDLEYTASLLQYYIDFIQSIDTDKEIECDGAHIPENITTAPVIEFRNVSFKYPNTDLYVLKDINITIHPGEHLSIVGRNGAGKTTFIKLLCRLYDVTEGEILLDGQNINTFALKDYIRLLSVVFQDYRLLAFSLRDNITLGKTNVSDQYLMELCDMGGIGEWIKSTEKGLDTIVYKMFDPSGIELSGGQAQKLAIVRALYKNSPVVILDEPTASLDPISEYEIYKHFDYLVGKKTAVYISHRLSSCQFCDRIVVFHNGSIIEEGRHDELLKIPSGFYANMYYAQAKHYQDDF